MNKESQKFISESSQSPKGDMLVYQIEDDNIKLDIRLEKDSLWMTQMDMALLFQCSADNISLHLKNIFNEGEMLHSATTEEFSVFRLEGNRDHRIGLKRKVNRL